MIAMDKGRAEAFSDGVFAIAITLLILEIKVPEGDELSSRALAAELAAAWPSFFAFSLSFLTILVTWMNHHGLFSLIRKTDRWLLLANGLLLMVVTFMPFPTALLAAHLQGSGANTAAVLYCSTNLLLNLAFNLFWFTATRRVLIAESVAPSTIKSLRNTYAVAAVVYLAAVILAWFQPMPGVILSSLLWLVWVTLTYSALPNKPRGIKE